jgi:hypothetical protein
MRMTQRAGTRLAKTCAAAALCLAVYATPALAQGIGVSINIGNWYGNHHLYTERCYDQARGGHWGREARWEGWCTSNARFRDSRPDARWRHDHPWDYGREGDRGR